MEKDELASYFEGNKRMKILYMKTFVDYDDIETPIKTIFNGSLNIILSASHVMKAYYTLETHEFNDKTHPLQLFAEGVKSHFVNLESI